MTDAAPPMEAAERTRAMLVSLGGSSEPVLHTINRQRPEYVLFFVSPGSAGEVQSVLRDLAYRCADVDRILTPSAELLADCYRVLRDQLPAKLRQWDLTWKDLTVDYTGGTKSMSVALVLATADRVHRYTYVGGVERDKGGLGVVLAGRERMLYLQNPWKELMRDELARIGVFLSTARYLTARDELAVLGAAAEPDFAALLGALAELAAGLASWDGFDHAQAITSLGRSYSFLKTYAAGARQASWTGLGADLAGSLAFLQRIARRRGSSDAGEALILDLIANADRRARIEHKYEDGVARLYSCLERAARFRLLARSPAIDNEKVSPDQLPAGLRDEFGRRFADAGTLTLKLPLLASYHLLDALGDPLGAAFAAREGQILRLLALRNRSILGHGETTVTEAGYRAFRELLVELLGIDDDQLLRFPEVPELQAI